MIGFAGGSERMIFLSFFVVVVGFYGITIVGFEQGFFILKTAEKERNSWY